MAKAKPSLTIAQMESVLGYKVDDTTYPSHISGWFYPDLRMVSDSSYERTREEFEIHQERMRTCSKDHNRSSAGGRDSAGI